jgi:uncharacterized membrane protein
MTDTLSNAVAASQKDARQDRLVWIAQVVLFLAFLTAGIMKLVLGMEELTRILTWPGALPEWFVRTIGVAEVLGAIGVLVPALTGIKPWLTALAAFGLMVLMICALGFHIMLFQGAMLLPSLVLGILAAFVGVRRM